MDTRDLTSQKYFNQTGITLEVDPSVDAEEFDIFNSLDLLARLTGAPDGSWITVSRGGGGEDFLSLEVKNDLFKYPSKYFIFNVEEGLDFELSVDSIYLREESHYQGIGTRSVILSIRQAKELGFRAVTLFAAGNAISRGMFFGYHVWPTLGFDAPLPGHILSKLPRKLQGGVLLSDLMRTSEGIKWWYDNGVGLALEFALENSSVSWELLSKYVEAKGISI